MVKIAIINDIHIGVPLERQNAVRAASHLAEEALPRLLDHIVKQHSPEMIVHLGDLIRSENKVSDLKKYQQGISEFSKVSCPVLHLVGNHELKLMSIEDVENIWQESGFNQKSYGMHEQDGIILIWLGLEHNPHRRIKHRLPSDQLIWLRETLEKITQPVLIFTHCAADDHDVSGNFFYEGYEIKNKNGFFLENTQEIQQICAHCEFVEMVIQAHLHYFHAKIIEKIPYITCPAMGDNICGPNITEHIPEIYSLLTLNNNQLTLKTFSREFCFAGVEFERRKQIKK